MSINKDVKILAQQCIACQKSKVSRHTKSPLGTFKLSSQRFSQIHLDIIGPLPISENQRYCVTLIDRYTRWTEAIPVPDISAATVAFAVYNSWISRFGVPESIVTDQGTQFESLLFTELSQLLGFQRFRTTSYNPKCNGMIERWHRTVKSSIMCYDRPDWTRILPSILLGLRTTFSEELQTTPAELTFGYSLRVPGQFLDSSSTSFIPQSDFVKELKQHFDEIRPTPASKHDSPYYFVSKDLTSCSHVFMRTDAVRKSLQPPYTGPFKVINRTDKNFNIEINGKISKISIDRLKPCYSEFFIDESQSTLTKTTTIEKQSKPIVETKPIIKKTVTFNDQTKIKFIPKQITTKSGRSVKTPSKFLDLINNFVNQIKLDYQSNPKLFI